MYGGETKIQAHTPRKTHANKEDESRNRKSRSSTSDEFMMIVGCEWGVRCFFRKFSAFLDSSIKYVLGDTSFDWSMPRKGERDTTYIKITVTINKQPVCKMVQDGRSWNILILGELGRNRSSCLLVQNERRVRAQSKRILIGRGLRPNFVLS